MAKVSVIVPIYNVSRFIKRCVESLFNQTLDDVEFIFVNDCTPDDSIDILKKVIADYPDRNTMIINHEVNKGLPAARNTGLKAASGDYIFHCDSDDFIEPTMLNDLYYTACDDNADIVWCDWYLTFEKNERYMKQPDYDTPKEALKAMLTGKMKYNVWNKLVRGSLYEENGIFFPSGYGMGEDMTMIMLFAYAKNVKYLPKAYYHYVKLNTNAFSNTYSQKHLEELKYNVGRIDECIFAWCGKKSLPTEISFETTNYATSTNLGFRIWWALEGTAISSWSNMETNPMIRCVRNLGTNSTSGEVSDITSWDQENYVVTVNGLKDETLRTNMQIGEYPEHENFDAASTLPKAFKIASADLNIPASGGDTYAPAITVGELNPTGIPESQSNTTPHNITVPVTITNYDASKNYTYQIGTGNEVNVTSAKFDVSVTINLSSTYNNATASKTIKIKSNNGNYTSFNVTVTLTTRGYINRYYTYTYSKSTPQQTIVTGGTPAKNTFKYTEIMNGDWCEKYYQEGTDDLGKWRIPNEKELYFIPMYCGEEITGNLAGYKPSGTETETGTMRYAAKTKYERPEGSHVEYMIYYLQKDGNSGTPIITTGHGQSDADFTIRCVRDAPQGTRSYDSSYSSGGTGFGL